MHYLDYNEQKQHGTIDFPIEFYHVDEHHSRYNMPFHWHRELEIIQILEGRLHLKLDDEELIARSGDIIFINEGVIHGGIPENCVYECIVFDIKTLLMHTDTCRQYIRQITKHKIFVHNHFTQTDKAFHRIVGHLFQSMREKSPGSELITLGTLYEVFGMIYLKKLYLETGDEPNPGSQKMALLKPVLEYIESSYASPVSLQDLSRIAGMSPKYFCRYFQSITHRTPIDYLNYYRIERACYQLDKNEASITDVAYCCGFNDTSYFIKTFKRYKNITPKQYSLNML